LSQSCPQCGSEELGAKFCMACGYQVSQSEGNVESQLAASHAEPSNGNTYVDQGKNMAKSYWEFLMATVKHPTQQAQTMNGGSMVNGLITLVLYSLLIPLMIYFVIKGTFGEFMAPSFSEVFFKPAFFILLFMALNTAVIYAVSKPGNSNLHFYDVVARFGGFLVVPTLLFVLAIIFSVLQLYTMVGFAGILGVLGLFIAATLTIYSLRRQGNQGIDAIYGTFLFYIAFYIIVRLISENIMINGLMQNMNPFGL